MNQTLDKNQAIIIGQTKHAQTGGYIVWLSLDGNEVIQVGAWKAQNDAVQAIQETGEAYRQVAEAMQVPVSDNEPQTGSINQWVQFRNTMKERSTDKMTPFPPAQLAEIARGIHALVKQRQAGQESPDGFSQVITYTDEALKGLERPRARLAPMNFPPKKKGR